MDGGTGNDTITTGNGADTVTLAASAGTDITTDFTAGDGGDKIAAAGIEAITTNDVTFLKSDVGAGVTWDVGATAGVLALAANVANAATLSAADLNTALTNGTISGADDGEKGIVLVSTDFDSAAVDVYAYIVEHDGTDFDGVTLLATFKNMELDNLTAANFDGFA